MTAQTKDKAQSGKVILSARNVAKSYGQVHALKGVNFDVHEGEVTTLFGENGAGKSTLMKILSGIVTASSGEIHIDGKPVIFNGPADADHHGIAIIHQELSLAPNLSVRDNIFLGREITGRGGIDYSKEARITAELMQDMEEDIDPLTKVEDLRLGQQQIVEIARALLTDSRILIMDEPTSALSASEVEVLFRLIGDLKAKGVSIVYISHHLEEALHITDHAVVLRDGNMTARGRRDEIDMPWIVRHMVGDNFDLGAPPQGYEMGPAALQIESLSVLDKDYKLAVNNLNLTVDAGEIVCIYGLMGAGRTELLETIAGRNKPASGKILLNGTDLHGLSTAQRIELGLSLVPEDRQRDGLVQTMSVGENLSLASISNFIRGFLTSARLETAVVDHAIQSVHIKTSDASAAIGSLSGGNQQKVVIGKMLATNPKVLLLDEPSRGIDIGAKSEVFKLIAEKAREGLGVLYSTSELEECFSVAHRIIVMSRGNVVAEFKPDVTKEQIMAVSGETLLSDE